MLRPLSPQNVQWERSPIAWAKRGSLTLALVSIPGMEFTAVRLFSIICRTNSGNVCVAGPENTASTAAERAYFRFRVARQELRRHGEKVDIVADAATRPIRDFTLTAGTVRVHSRRVDALPRA